MVIDDEPGDEARCSAAAGGRETQAASAPSLSQPLPATLLTRRSPSPIHLDTRLEAEMEKNTAEMLVAMALPSIVLPAAGGRQQAGWEWVVSRRQAELGGGGLAQQRLVSRARRVGQQPG